MPDESPEELVKNTKPGDKVRISLRGPHTDEELAEIKRIHEAEYPGVEFEFTWDDDTIRAEVERGESA